MDSATAAAPQGGCAYDAQCKGDRVCQQEGPADRAGVQEWDALLAIDGVPVEGLREAAMRLPGAPGTLVRLRLMRGGMEHSVEVARQP